MKPDITLCASTLSHIQAIANPVRPLSFFENHFLRGALRVQAGLLVVAILVLLIARAAFAADTVSVQPAMSARCSSTGLKDGRSAICVNNDTPFSLSALVNGTQRITSQVGAQTSPVYLVANDTGSSSFTLTYRRSLPDNEFISCRGLIPGGTCSIAGTLGTASDAEHYGPPSVGSREPLVASLSFTGVPVGSTFYLTFATDNRGSSGTLSCDGYCLKQPACEGAATTSISGTVYAPNGADPLPNVLVYIPNAPIAGFPAAVSCGQESALVSGRPLVSTYTAANGTFTLTNVPAGDNIPLVIQAGRWRRQVSVPAVNACAHTSFSTRFPKDQTEGDIPRIALVTGSADATECVLRKTGIADSEFTNPLERGRISIFTGEGAGGNSSAAGARIDASTPQQSDLLGNASALNTYDMIMLPCQGAEYIESPGDLAKLFDFANAGGRVFATHFSHAWLDENADFAIAADWKAARNSIAAEDGKGSLEKSFDGGATLSQSQAESSITAGIAPAMQTAFNTPVGAVPAEQCGRVLFSEYHAENSPGESGLAFPTECEPGEMTAQEKVIEYSLFDLSNFIKPAATKPQVKPDCGCTTKATVTLTADSTKWNYPGSTNVSVCVNIDNGSYPLGSVEILDGTRLLTTLQFHGSVNCISWYIPLYLDAGYHDLRAVYTDKHNHASSTTLKIEVNRGWPTAEISCWNYQFPYGSDYKCDFNMDSGTTKGYITYRYDGGNPVVLWLNSWGGVNFSIHRPHIGYHKVVVTYPQQDNWNAYELPIQYFWVDPTPVQVSITPSSWYAKVGTKFSFQVYLTSSSAPPPNHVGTVYFTDGPKQIAALPIDANGHVEFFAGALAQGTHVITANYIGAGDYANGWASATVSVGK